MANRKRIAGLIEKNRVTASTYKSLDEKINSVATKVIHLGDQLESVNTPRSRGCEALKLMRHFEPFKSIVHIGRDVKPDANKSEKACFIQRARNAECEAI